MSGRAARVLAAIATSSLVVAALLTFVPSATALIYWAGYGNGAIGRAENDGLRVDTNFITGLQTPASVAVNGTHIYWAEDDRGSIGRANIDGTGVDRDFITGIDGPRGVAVSSSFVYWTSLGEGTVGRATLDGGNPEKDVVPGIGAPCGVAVDSGHVYWTDAEGSPSYIGRSQLDGDLPEYQFVKIPGISFPCGVAVNTANIFWTDTGAFGPGTNIGRANVTNGAGADASIIGDASGPCGIAVFGSQIYWANITSNTIGRANTDSTGVNQAFVTTGSDEACGVAVDTRTLPAAPTAPIPPADVLPPKATISKGPGKKLARGIAKFSFKSSEPGSTFQCKLDRKKPAKCKSPKTYKRLKPGRHTSKLWAIDAAGNKSQPAKRSFRVPA
jgi:hypothetical protein